MAVVGEAAVVAEKAHHNLRTHSVDQTSAHAPTMTTGSALLCVLAATEKQQNGVSECLLERFCCALWP